MLYYTNIRKQSTDSLVAFLELTSFSSYLCIVNLAR